MRNCLIAFKLVVLVAERPKKVTGMERSQVHSQKRGCREKIRLVCRKEKHLGHKELLQLEDKDVEPVEDVGGELGHHEEEQVEVHRDRPLQPILVHLTAKIGVSLYTGKIGKNI